jgi:hypothetical protein
MLLDVSVRLRVIYLMLIHTLACTSQSGDTLTKLHLCFESSPHVESDHSHGLNSSSFSLLISKTSSMQEIRQTAPQLAKPVEFALFEDYDAKGRIVLSIFCCRSSPQSTPERPNCHREPRCRCCRTCWRQFSSHSLYRFNSIRALPMISEARITSSSST